MDKSVGMAIDALQADADASSNLSWGTCARDARGSISVDRPVRVDDAFLSGEVVVLVSDGDTPNLSTDFLGASRVDDTLGVFGRVATGDEPEGQVNEAQL